jgi:hypothetical protein
LGIVLLRMNFGDTGSYGPGNALIVWEAFKVYGGQIHAVEAFMRIMPASAGSGWDLTAGEQGLAGVWSLYISCSFVRLHIKRWGSGQNSLAPAPGKHCDPILDQ